MTFCHIQGRVSRPWATHAAAVAFAGQHGSCIFLEQPILAEGRPYMRFGMLHLFENPIGKTEHQVIHEQMELMRDKVMPHLRDSDPPPPPTE